MSSKNGAPRGWQATGGVGRDGGLSRPHCTTTEGQNQAPAGDLPAYLKDNMVYVAGRHLCSVRDGVLARTFDPTRELMHGALWFRCDVLALAQRAGCLSILATERNTGTRYRVGMAELLRRGSLYDHPRYGRQVGLALAAWLRVPDERDQDRPRQLTLFGEAGV